MKCVHSQEINKYKIHVEYLPSKCPPPFHNHLLFVDKMFQRFFPEFCFIWKMTFRNNFFLCTVTWYMHGAHSQFIHCWVLAYWVTVHHRFSKRLPPEWMHAWIPPVMVLGQLWIVGWAEKCLEEMSLYLNILGFLSLPTDKNLNACGEHIISLQLKTKCLQMYIHMKCFPCIGVWNSLLNIVTLFIPCSKV